MIFLSNPKLEEYGAEAQYDKPARLGETIKLLRAEGHKVLLSERIATFSDLFMIHDSGLLKTVKEGKLNDTETPNFPDIHLYASLSFGVALDACDLAMNYKEHVFSINRPPGHHSGRENTGGFCYFNNAVGAAMHATAYSRRVGMIDFDFHHGNGSQDIVLGGDRILHVDIHAEGEYPNTGSETERNCFNFPLDKKECTETMYFKTLEEALGRVANFKPNLLVVSAGFDGHKDDPIGGLGLNEGSFRQIGKMIKGLNVPSVSVLEGGYNIDVLPKCVLEYARGFD